MAVVWTLSLVAEAGINITNQQKDSAFKRWKLSVKCCKFGSSLSLRAAASARGANDDNWTMDVCSCWSGPDVLCFRTSVSVCLRSVGPAEEECYCTTRLAHIDNRVQDVLYVKGTPCTCWCEAIVAQLTTSVPVPQVLSDKHLPVSCAGHSCDCYKTTFCVIAPPPPPPPVSAQPVSLISAACETLGLLLTCGPHTPRGGPPPVMDVSHRGPGRTLWWWGGGGCLRCHDVTPPGPAEGQTYGPHRTRRRMFVCLFIY